MTGGPLVIDDIGVRRVALAPVRLHGGASATSGAHGDWTPTAG